MCVCVDLGARSLLCIYYYLYNEHAHTHTYTASGGLYLSYHYQDYTDDHDDDNIVQLVLVWVVFRVLFVITTEKIT